MYVCAYAKNPRAVLIPAQHAPAELSGKLSRDFGGALDYIKKQHIKNLHLERVGQILRSGYLRAHIHARILSTHALNTHPPLEQQDVEAEHMQWQTAASRQYNRQMANAERIRRLRENNEGYRETERRANALATAERMGNFTQFITYTCNEYQHNRPEHIHHGNGVNEESQ